jgi:hypothetical protein
VSGEAHAFEKIGGAACGDECGGSVGENDVAAGAELVRNESAAKNFVDD